ncbi:MAG: hypothetical protein JNM70_18880 [Anaerolineae bacterium]|nr:hypothetical protein [Anaerolineae bacterium]
MLVLAQMAAMANWHSVPNALHARREFAQIAAVSAIAAIAEARNVAKVENVAVATALF